MGIALGMFTVLLFLASFFSSKSLDLQCIIALLLGLEATLAARELRYYTRREPEFFASTFNGPFLLCALFAGFLVLPVMSPQWMFVQPAIFAFGAIGGSTGAHIR